MDIGFLWDLYRISDVSSYDLRGGTLVGLERMRGTSPSGEDPVSGE
jgi:hypothetical protein